MSGVRGVAALCAAAVLLLSGCGGSTPTPRTPRLCEESGCAAPGVQRWSTPLPGAYILDQDRPFSADLESRGSWVSVVAGPSEAYALLGNRVLAVDAATGRIRWDRSLGEVLITDWVRAGRFVLLGTASYRPARQRHWSVLDLENGRVSDSPVTAARPAPTLGDGRSVLVPTGTGQGALVDVYLGTPSWSGPLPAGESLLAADPILYAVTAPSRTAPGVLNRTDLRTGTPLPPVPLPPTVLRPSLIAATAGGVAVVDGGAKAFTVGPDGAVAEQLPAEPLVYPQTASDSGSLGRSPRLVGIDSGPGATQPEPHRLTYRGVALGPAYAGLNPWATATTTNPPTAVTVVCPIGATRPPRISDPVDQPYCDEPALVSINLPK
ncbi:MAG: hypothetical protein HOQ24_02360 [Mycobacteriaceae bacterium]|nr:hypothetical protein [Mycobacteriaceae bacterium]